MSKTHAQQPAVDREAQFIERFVAGEVASCKHELHKVIVGQEDVLELLLAAIFARGHCLLVGVPGLAKTLMISTLAQGAEAELQPHPVHAGPDARGHHRAPIFWRKIQTTGKRRFRFVKGPIFANILLADEINRTPPKTQAALLQAMQEYQVTAGGPHAIRSSCRFSCWRRRTRSSRRGRIRCPRRSSTGSCSW